MSDKSKIEWTDATWNPTRGCSRVSEGCRNCYAERVAARFSGPGQPYEGLAKITPSGARWTGKVILDGHALQQPLHWRAPRRIFVNSMSDLFHEKLSDSDVRKVFEVMAYCPQHQFQVLTKRPERMLHLLRYRRDRLICDSAEHHRLLCTMPLPNVWLGVSVEDQATADARIPILLQCPAAVRFVSYEPALGPVDFSVWLKPVVQGGFGVPGTSQVSGLSWLIAGGESGPGARPAHPDWFRSVRDQCQRAGVPFFLKQLCEGGRKLPWDKIPADLQIREFPK